MSFLRHWLALQCHIQTAVTGIKSSLNANHSGVSKHAQECRHSPLANVCNRHLLKHAMPRETQRQQKISHAIIAED
eukprot:6492116-Amphidinium_carterae.5